MQVDAAYLNDMLDIHLLTIFVVGNAGHECLFCKEIKLDQPMFVAVRIIICDGQAAKQVTGYGCCACSKVLKPDAKRTMAVSAFLVIELSKQMDKWIARVAKTLRKSTTAFADRLLKLIRDKTPEFTSHISKTCLLCLYCKKPLPNVKCGKCLVARFCDEACAKKVWNKHMQEQCCSELSIVLLTRTMKLLGKK
ncbi:MAG: hypothetical protein K2Q45_05305 [Nitrosomonas sp.]|nr:hypothetical protein [Nitrosomonas sp.]